MNTKLSQLDLDELIRPLTWLIVANIIAEIVVNMLIFGSFNPIYFLVDLFAVACAFGLFIRSQAAFYGLLGASFFNLLLARMVFQTTLGLAAVLALYAILYKRANKRWPDLT